MSHDPIEILQSLQALRLSPAEKNVMSSHILASVEKQEIPVREGQRQRLSDTMDTISPILANMNKAEEFSLSKAEKSNMLRAIRTRIAAEPEPQEPVWNKLFSLPMRLIPIMTTVTAVFVVMIGTAAAERALPGDFLYPIKVLVNENVRAGFAFSDRDRAAWDIARAERRLDEAATLAVEGNMTPDISADVSTRLQNHVAAAERTIGQLRASNNTAAATAMSVQLESTLGAHQALLVRIATDHNASSAMNPLLTTVATETANSTLAVEASVQEDSAPRLPLRSGTLIREATVAAIETAQGDVSVTRSAISATAAARPYAAPMLMKFNPSNEQNEIEKKLSSAETSLMEAQAHLDAGADADAFATVRASLRDATEAKLLLQHNIQPAKSPTLTTAPASEPHAAIAPLSASSSSTYAQTDADLVAHDRALYLLDVTGKKIADVRALLAKPTPWVRADVRTTAETKIETAAKMYKDGQEKIAMNHFTQAQATLDLSFQMTAGILALIQPTSSAASSAVTSSVSGGVTTSSVATGITSSSITIPGLPAATVTPLPVNVPVKLKANMQLGK